jgi:hypothetical protein
MIALERFLRVLSVHFVFFLALFKIAAVFIRHNLLYGLITAVKTVVGDRHLLLDLRISRIFDRRNMV